MYAFLFSLPKNNFYYKKCWHELFFDLKFSWTFFDHNFFVNSFSNYKLFYQNIFLPNKIEVIYLTTQSLLLYTCLVFQVLPLTKTLVFALFLILDPFIYSMMISTNHLKSNTMKYAFQMRILQMYGFSKQEYWTIFGPYVYPKE